MTNPRVFADCRDGTDVEVTADQMQEITVAGFTVDQRCVVAETGSGSVAAKPREGFAKLLDRMVPGDVLVMTKLDRLGSDAIDVRATVERLEAIGVRVHCLALGGTDMTHAEGQMTMQGVNAVSEFERAPQNERTDAGIEHARREGKSFGRPSALTAQQRDEVLTKLAAGTAIAQIARDYRVSRQTIMRVRAAAGYKPPH